MKIVLILSQFFAVSMAFAGQKVVCFNKEFGKLPLSIEIGDEVATFSFGSKSCVLNKVTYNPVSEKYKGWIRYANQNTYNTQEHSTACKEPMAAYYNQNSKNSVEFPDMDWISVSVELQTSSQGILQLGYQNLWDPGAGGTVKTMLGCFPDKN